MYAQKIFSAHYFSQSNVKSHQTFGIKMYFPAFLKGELFSFLQRLFQDLGVVSHSASSSFLPTSAYCLCVRTSY